MNGMATQVIDSTRDTGPVLPVDRTSRRMEECQRCEAEKDPAP